MSSSALEIAKLGKLLTVVDGMTVPCPQQDIVAEQVGQELFLNRSANPASVTVLNSGAAIVWYLLDGERSVDTIARIVSDEYGIEYEAATTDVLKAVHEMSEHGLLLIG